MGYMQEINEKFEENEKQNENQTKKKLLINEIRKNGIEISLDQEEKILYPERFDDFGYPQRYSDW